MTESKWIKIGEDMQEILEKDSRNCLFLNNLVNLNLTLKDQAELNLVMILTESEAVGVKKWLIDLAGIDAVLNVLVLMKLGGKVNLSLDSLAKCSGLKGKVNFVFRSILTDQAQVNFLGNLAIPQSGQQSEVRLEAESLLFSNQAVAKTTPALEIVANDVKASHAASLGKIDSEMLFYLQCRGWDKAQAEQMLVEAFWKKAVNQMPENLREEIWTWVEEKLI